MKAKKQMKTMDGNTAAAYISYAFTDVAAIYPITPSSPMAEVVDEWSANGKKNLFGQTVRVVEMQSEAGASGAVHGSLQGGALTTTYTASQGLLLMIPNMYKMAGELLPAVFHVSARALATSSLSIFGDQQDVMAVRQTGFAMLAESSVQEVMDLAAVAHLSAIKGRVPFVNFFDGFRTSHEIQKVEVMDYADLDKMLDKKAVTAFRQRALNPDNPVIRGTNQNPDIYFQTRESVNGYYSALPKIVEEYIGKINKVTGRDYKLFNYYGDPKATDVVVAMGSCTETLRTVVEYLCKKGKKVGVVVVHLYRPFVGEKLLAAIPKTAKRIAVLDRTKEPGGLGEPLYLDVRAAFYDSSRKPLIIGGRYGLGSKEFLPCDALAVFENLAKKNPQNGFTVGITDDVTKLSVAAKPLDVTPQGTKGCKFWGLGSDGTVGANKSAIKIIGDYTDLYAQGYFFYDSKKSGGVTVSHLRFGKTPIQAPYLVNAADFVAVHNQTYVYKYDVYAGLKKGGVFLLNCNWKEEELDAVLPGALKRYIAQNKIKFYIIDAVAIAKEIGLGGRINMIMQSAFFKLADIIPLKDAVKHLKDAVEHSYGKKGQNIVDMNNAAIDQGIDAIVEVKVPAAWAKAKDSFVPKKTGNKFVDNIMVPMNRLNGDSLPVSVFAKEHMDGTFPSGTSKFEKRGTAIDVPEWQVEACIQCNQCAFVCPHSAIRPVLMTEEEAKKAPASMKFKDALGVPGMKFTMQVSPADCQGCGSCAQVCPAPKMKALVMKALATQENQKAAWEYAINQVKHKNNPMPKNTIKGVQFEEPLLEFSGACAGCGEAPYAKLVTQLFGDRMMIANATGCTSIWGAAAPSMPYTKNSQGHGPSWANSLFEDNAEYGLGMCVGVRQEREHVKGLVEQLLQEKKISVELVTAARAWLDGMYLTDGTRERADAFVAALTKEKKLDLVQKILQAKQFLVKRSHWIFGGDGWGYDIGYGGLDHVLASGENVNVMIFDTEVYSNTGGQSSKSTPAAAIAKFAASGKQTKKKDIGMMAMSYGYVYVAQINMGADKAQTLKAIMEAEAYEGPSLIIAYSPCINHGLKVGMGCSQLEGKRAVECGYWSNYRYNPQLKAEGKNPFTLDSAEPTGNFRDFLMGEVRYSSLAKLYPDKAEQLFAKTEKDAKERLENYKRLAGK